MMKKNLGLKAQQESNIGFSFLSHQSCVDERFTHAPLLGFGLQGRYLVEKPSIGGAW
jgi:hypothetical protein